MKNVIAYEGNGLVSLGVMQEAYVPLFLPWLNWRIGIEGTLQRPPYSLNQGLEWVRRLDQLKGSHEVFAILIQKKRRGVITYEYVGHTGIHGVKWPDGLATTGSLIGVSAARGRGYGTEAKLLLLYHAFMVLGLRKVISQVKAFNAPSAAHLLKCGYQPCGRNRRHCFHEGDYIDEVHFEVFREEWQPIWLAYQKSGTLPTLTSTQRAFLAKEMSA